MNARLVLPLILWSGAAAAQGFAGLGTEAGGFALPDPAHVITFPADHGPHEDFRIEWWYLTANLTGADGTPYGLQWTLFRTALAPGAGAGWSSPQLWMGHAAVTTPTDHHLAERIARGGIGQAGVTADPFIAWIDDWEMAAVPCAPPCDGLDRLQVSASGADFAYDIALEAQGPIVLHGEAGYSVKSPGGQASHYYSQPFYTVAGTLVLPDGPVPVTGQAWLDREWSSQPLGADQSGWDWFSLSFADGAKLMGFVLRADDGADFSAATWIEAGGGVTAYPDGAFAATPLATAPVAGREVPVAWRVTLPDRAVDVTVTALNDQTWMETMVPYWEGPVTIAGSHAGVGYLEMTGY